MPQLRQGSLACFLLGSLTLATSWTIFQVAANSDAACIVADESGTGAVVASGRFREIIRNDGSASIDLIATACVFGFVVTGFLIHHIQPCKRAIRKRSFSCRDMLDDSHSEEKSQKSQDSSPRHLSPSSQFGMPSKCELEESLDVQHITLECSSDPDRQGPSRSEGKTALLPELIGCSADPEIGKDGAFEIVALLPGAEFVVEFAGSPGVDGTYITTKTSWRKELVLAQKAAP